MFLPTSFLFSLHVLAVNYREATHFFLPRPPSHGFGGNTGLICPLFPDLPPYCLNPHLTSTMQTPGGARAFRAAAKIKSLSPTVKLLLPWVGRLLVGCLVSAGTGEKYFIYLEVWDRLVVDIVALVPSWCLLCKARALILKGMCVGKQSLSTMFPVWRAFVCWLWPSFWKNFTIQLYCLAECFAVWIGLLEVLWSLLWSNLLPRGKDLGRAQ